MAAVSILVLLFPFFVYETSKAAEAPTAEILLGMLRLSRKLDIVSQEINTVKADMAEIKLDVSNMEDRVEKIETNMTDMKKKIADEKKGEISKYVVTENLKRHSKGLRYMLSFEKAFLRQKIDHFQSVLNGFESDIKSEFSVMNFTVRNSIESLEQAVTDYKSETSTSLVEMKFVVQTMMNETDNRVTTKLMALEKEQVTNGGWGSWKSWTTCTTTCDSGIQSRQRHCDNPKPAAGGDFCDGSPSEVRQCNQQHCPRIKASFSVKIASIGSDSILRFSYVDLNEGSHYDKTTGVFTCHYPGLYAFIANIVEGGSGSNAIDCYIRSSSSDLSYMRSRQGIIDGKYAVHGAGSATGAATVRLVKGDQVYVSCSSGTGTSLSWSSFTGFLVSSDP